MLALPFCAGHKFEARQRQKIAQFRGIEEVLGVDRCPGFGGVLDDYAGDAVPAGRSGYGDVLQEND